MTYSLSMQETNGDAWVIAAADVVVHTDVLGRGRVALCLRPHSAGIKRSP